MARSLTCLKMGAMKDSHSALAMALLGCLVLAPRPAAAEVSEALRYRYYSGAIEPWQSLYCSLLKASPIRESGKPFLGRTNWQIRWDLRWQAGRSGRCTLERVHTRLDATITLPQRAPGDGRAQASFEHFSQALLEHKQHHLSLAREAAKAIDKRIWQLPTMSSCHALNQAANQIGQRVLDKARRDERAYDQSTGHGRTEGAVLRQ
jgi:predicted secreted Zn-dependent protease